MTPDRANKNGQTSQSPQCRWVQEHGWDHRYLRHYNCQNWTGSTPTTILHRRTRRRLGDPGLPILANFQPNYQLEDWQNRTRERHHTSTETEESDNSEKVAVEDVKAVQSTTSRTRDLHEAHELCTTVDGSCQKVMGPPHRSHPATRIPAS